MDKNIVIEEIYEDIKKEVNSILQPYLNRYVYRIDLQIIQMDKTSPDDDVVTLERGFYIPIGTKESDADNPLSREEKQIFYQFVKKRKYDEVYSKMNDIHKCMEELKNYFHKNNEIKEETIQENIDNCLTNNTKMIHDSNNNSDQTAIQNNENHNNNSIFDDNSHSRDMIMYHNIENIKSFCCGSELIWRAYNFDNREDFYKRVYGQCKKKCLDQKGRVCKRWFDDPTNPKSKQFYREKVIPLVEKKDPSLAELIANWIVICPYLLENDAT